MLTIYIQACRNLQSRRMGSSFDESTDELISTITDSPNMEEFKRNWYAFGAKPLAGFLAPDHLHELDQILNCNPAKYQWPIYPEIPCEELHKFISEAELLSSPLLFHLYMCFDLSDEKEAKPKNPKRRISLEYFDNFHGAFGSYFVSEPEPSTRIQLEFNE